MGVGRHFDTYGKVGGAALEDVSGGVDGGGNGGGDGGAAWGSGCCDVDGDGVTAFGALGGDGFGNWVLGTSLQRKP